MSKETWDELQQTLLLVLSFGMWFTFELWCFKDSAFAALPHTPAVRLVLTNIVTGIFAYIYTKSTANTPRGNNDARTEQEKRRDATGESD